MVSAFPFATSRQAVRPGRVAVAPAVSGRAWSFGAFELELHADPLAQLVVRASGSNGVFRSPPGRAWLAAAQGSYRATGRAGHLRPVEKLDLRFRHQWLASVDEDTVDGRPALLLRGHLALEPDELKATARDGTAHVAYELRLVDIDGRRCGVEVDLLPPAGADGSCFAELLWEQPPSARVFGFGAQFTYLDMRGREVPILTAEQGVGRGAQPLTRYTEAFGGAGGDWWSTYAPVPGFVTTELCGLLLRNTEPMRFDLRRPGVGSARVYAAQLRALVYCADAPAELLELHTRATGRMPALPDWVHSGAIVGLQGGNEKVEQAVADLEAAGAKVAGVWLQDWVGNRQVPFGTRLWWDWQRDEERYPDWHGMRGRLARNGVRILTYVNPFLAPMTDRPGSKPGLFDAADAAGYFVKTATGETYLTDQGDFQAGLIDLSNPEARAWYLEVLAENLTESGASGWMADFGEGLPLDAHLASGTALAWHNHYPEAWAAFNHDLRARVAELSGGAGGDYVTFFRSGFTRSPGNAGLFWLGDQCVTWDRFDGLASALTGLLSSGFSGFALNHGDVGGYTSTLSPLPVTVRTPELLARWGELMAFTPVLRSHEGNRPQHNAQVYSTAETRGAFARAARLHAQWVDLRRELMRQAAATGVPVVRHPWLQYPADAQCADLTGQFFLGPDLLVAPVLQAGASSVRAYLPAGSGTWRHRWTGAAYAAGAGAWVEVPAPVGQPGLFDREN